MGGARCQRYNQLHGDVRVSTASLRQMVKVFTSASQQPKLIAQVWSYRHAQTKAAHTTCNKAEIKLKENHETNCFNVLELFQGL